MNIKCDSCGKDESDDDEMKVKLTSHGEPFIRVRVRHVPRVLTHRLDSPIEPAVIE